SLPGLLLWSRRAATLARRHKVRFVHCGNVKPAGYPARWVLERCRVPYGIYFHGGDLLSEQHKIRHSRLKRRSTRAILGGAAVLMVNSAWTRDLALSVLGELGLDGHGQRLRVVHLGTDPGRFMPGVDPTELRERLGLPEDGVRWMLTVARLTPHKGADTVLRALPAILEHAPDVRYAVAGSGPALDQLEELASAIGVADRVSFLGSVSDRDLPALYNLASVYVGASRLADRIGVEGFGISLVEASACGLPVVAGNSGGIPDAVRDGETGFLVPPEDPAALAAAIVLLLASPGLAKRVGAAGRRAGVSAPPAVQDRAPLDLDPGAKVVALRPETAGRHEPRLFGPILAKRAVLRRHRRHDSARLYDRGPGGRTQSGNPGSDRRD